MTKTYLLFFILLATACAKDPVALPDNYIEYDETLYTPGQNDKSFGTWCDNYDCGTGWSIETQNQTLHYEVHNTCDNNRGAASNYRGEVVFNTNENNKVLTFVGKTSLFKHKNIYDKWYFEFKDLKCYLKIGGSIYYDSLVYKTVSGRVLR